MTTQPAVNWRSLGQEDFERLVEVLIHRVHPEPATVKVIDGRGGDGGKDVDVTLPDGRRIIYQLKYFPEGFTGPHVGRRPQIKRSFTSIEAEYPYQWVLVSPHKLVPSEWAYLAKLAPEGHPTNVAAWDQARLDSHLAKHPDLVAYLQRTPELERVANLYNQEKAALLDPGKDLVDRVRALQDLASTVDPYYSLDFQTQGSTIIRTLRAKDPRAYEARPVSINFSAAASTPALRNVIGWGTRETVTLTGDQIRDFSVTGTVLMGDFGLPDEIRFIPTIQEPIPCSLDALDDTQARIRRFSGAITHLGRGHEGISIETLFYDTVAMKFWLSADPTKPEVKVDITISLRPGTSPALLEKAAHLADLQVTAAGIRLVGPKGETYASLAGRQTIKELAFAAEMRALRELAEDVSALTDHLKVDLTIPPEPTDLDRVRIRVLRHALEGKVSIDPVQNGFTVVIPPEAPEEPLADLLAGRAFSCYVRSPAQTVSLAGMELEVPELSYWHPNLAAVAEPTQLALLGERRSRGEEISVRIRSRDGTNLRVYMIDRVPGSATVSPWALEGIQEADDSR